jgi:hypothetical protein
MNHFSWEREFIRNVITEMHLCALRLYRNAAALCAVIVGTGRKGWCFPLPGQMTFRENEGGREREYQRRSGCRGEDKIPCPSRISNMDPSTSGVY